jgi:hypothetical protein
MGLPSSEPTGEADVTAAGQPAGDLQADARAAPESQWFFAWFKSAMLYLAAVTAYLVAATAIVAAWKTFVAAPGEKVDLTIYAIAGILALPLLFALWFNLLPALRRRWERSMWPAGKGDERYFITAPREDDPYGLFRKGYEPFLNWARHPQAPLLHLTGLSGSGKSSLLTAYLRPRLAEPEPGPCTRLLIIRTYHDPLAELKRELLCLWDRKPADYEALSPLESLRRAARRLGKNERLLVAFDQFEEFFLLRAVAEKTTEGASTPAVADAEVAPLREFLQGFGADPPEGVTVLLSYREDHRRLLTSLCLPARQEHKNWMTVDPLDFAAASAFLRSCPGLRVPEHRMDRVLREAARQEGGRVLMRPIVANLLGLILRQMSGHPTLWRRSGDLLRGYVADCLGRESKEERARVLRSLLTDFQTARPRSAADIARETKLNAAAVDAYLEHFGRSGLVRCVNRDERDPGRRVWQIAHDFLATLIERVLDGVHRTLWRHLRPWLAPTALVLALTAGVIWPWVEKQRAISLLTNAGFTWNEQNAAIVAATEEARRVARLEPLATAIHRLRPRSLDLTNCAALQDVDGLKGLASLQSLKLEKCNALEDVDGLKGLASLEELHLSYCSALQNVDGLDGLTSLQCLNLDCGALQNVDFVKGLTSLQTLRLLHCDALQNVDGLKGLTSLRSLLLFGCRSLQDIDGLRGLTSLQNLHVIGCVALQNVGSLSGLTTLRSLDLDGCRTLHDVEFLKGLTSLQSLDLTACVALQNVDSLKGLSSLQNVSLMCCVALPNINGLKGLASLHKLNLSACDALQNVNGLKGLTSLQELNLSNCSMLQNLEGLNGLTSLRSLDLTGCNRLAKNTWPSFQTATPNARIVYPDKTVFSPKGTAVLNPGVIFPEVIGPAK